MDERGFVFLLPNVGLPDPSADGDWVSIKAAIGPKEESLCRLNGDQELELPVRQKEHDTVLMPIGLERSILILPLVKPTSSSPNAPAEYFTVMAKHTRIGKNARVHAQSKLLPGANFVIYPMVVYEDNSPD